MILKIRTNNGALMTIDGVTSFSVEGIDDGYKDNTKSASFETVRRAIKSTDGETNIPVREE